jgi:hypothetical protein
MDVSSGASVQRVLVKRSDYWSNLITAAHRTLSHGFRISIFINCAPTLTRGLRQGLALPFAAA